MMEDITFTDMERDALKETANVGAGGASIVLSKIMDKKVNLIVDYVEILNMDGVSKAIGGEQQLMVGLYTPIVEGVKGNMVMTMDKNSAILIANEVLSTEKASAEYLTEEGQTSLKKVGNIVAEKYVGTLNQFLDYNMQFSETNIISAFGESMGEVVTMAFDDSTNDVMMIMTEFSVDETEIEGKFLFMISVSSVEDLLNRLRKNLF